MMDKKAKATLSHVNTKGELQMVDVGHKSETVREAVARGFIKVDQDALHVIRSGTNRKGDPLQVARIAGIMAAKRTCDLIPLCHPIQVDQVDVDLLPKENGYEIEARVSTCAKTGVEMEALTAVTMAALTIYDMVKAVDRTMSIGDIRLIEKKGGRSGTFTQD